MPRSGCVIQRNCALRVLDSFRQKELTLAPSKQGQPDEISVNKRRVGIGKAGVEADSRLEKSAGTIVVFGLEFRVVPQATVITLPGLEAVRWLARGALTFAALDIREDRFGDSRGDLVLHSKDVSQVA